MSNMPANKDCPVKAACLIMSTQYNNKDRAG